MGVAVSGLNGCRVLVVEDEPLIVLDIESMLEALGCVVAGTALDVGTARQLANNLAIDVALLDLVLKRDSTFDVAQILLSRSVPIILATGMDRGAVPERYAGLPILGKPFNQDELQEYLRRATSSELAEDRIRMTAYFLWEQDGRQDGRAEYYWEAAKAAREREIAADEMLKERPRHALL
jgi:DNA-binding response OmpR family regulator